MQQLVSLVEANLIPVLLVLGGITLLNIILLLVNGGRIRKLNKKYRQLMRGIDNKNLEEILLEHINHVELAVEKVNETELLCRRLNNTVQNCVQRVSLVRFNAFQDMGSDLSFALALLNVHGDGVVLSCIAGRDESRVYCKGVEKGKSTYYLSEEEELAIKKAMKLEK